MLSALFLAASIHQPGAFSDVRVNSEPKVTYSTTAKALRRILEEISVATAVPLAVSQELAEEPLILDVREVTLSELRTRIAQAMSAEWVHESGADRLLRSPALSRRLQSEASGRDVARMQTILDQEKRKLGELKPFDKEAADALAQKLDTFLKPEPGAKPEDIYTNFERIKGITSKAPTAGLARRIFCSFDARTLAGLPRGGRVTFANRAYPLQRPLPQAAQAILGQASGEWALWCEAAQQRGLGRYLEDRNTWESNVLALLKGATSDASVFHRVLFTLSLQNMNAGCVANFKVADMTGKIVVRGYETFYADSWRSNMNRKFPTPQLGELPIELSKLAAESYELTTKLYTTGYDEIPQMSGAIREQMLHPESFDPLASFYSEYLIGLARHHRLQLVAYLSDAGASPLGTHRQGALSPSQVRSILENMGGNVVEDRAGWLTVRPSEPLECLRNRESRKALGEFLRTRIKEGRASLEAYAKYISSKRVDALDNWHIGSALLQLLPPGQGPSRWTGQREAIWLHGSLNPNQRTALKMGALNMRQLSPDQHRMVIRILTNTDSSRLAKDDKPYESEQKEQMNAAFAYDSILNDATEALPEGVLPSAPMSLELKQTPGLFGSLRSGGGEPQEFAQTGEAVALSWWSATHPGVTNDQTTFDWVVPQDCTIYSYVLRPKPGLRLTFTLKDYLNAGPRVKSMADLPEAFVKKVKSLVKLPPSLESSRN